MANNIYVLLGDVISSRTIKNREEFQEKLIQACKNINKSYKTDIWAPLEIIKGSDEIGCVLTSIDNLYEIINILLGELSPRKMRFVLVKGQIDTKFTSKKISLMDGPVFHKASDLMLSLKKEKLLFKMDTGNKKIDILITNNINLIYLLKNNWSPKKMEIVRSYDKLKDQKMVAHALKLSQQTVSYHITTSNWKELKIIENNLKHVLKGLCD